MRPVKSGVIALCAIFGLSTGSAHAFGPMMLLMLPMMAGGQHAMGSGHGSGEENKTHGAPATHAEQSHPASAGERPVPSTGQSEPSQARSEAEPDPAPRENPQ